MAIIPEDGWAMVREGETIFFVRPPFRKSERVPVSEATLADAVAVHGYEPRTGTPEESWGEVIERIREAMVAVNRGKSLPTNSELLARILRSGPLSVLTGLLDKVEREWLVSGDLFAAGRALGALLSEERVKKTPTLMERASLLLVKLAELHAQKNAGAPARDIPSRLAKVRERPGIASYKAKQRPVGAAWMFGKAA